MKTVVAAFYADIFGEKSRFDEFLPMILASQYALSVTNPDAHYIVLTDNSTAKLLDKHDINFNAIAPEYMPLMSKIVFAQREFMFRCDADLIILPDVDCFANRDLSDSIPNDVGMAITHRGKKFEYRINNLAYIRDKDLAYWFLDRAYDVLESWPLEKRLWEGDQESWEAALAPPPSKDTWYDFEDLGNDILLSCPEKRWIYLYPCSTHNCFMSDGGRIMPHHDECYMLHLKGTRKKHLAMWMKHRFGYEL